MVSAWLEPPSARPAERCAGVRDGILQAFAFGTTETPPEVTFLKGRRLRSAPLFFGRPRLTEGTTPRPAFVIKPAIFSTLFERTMRSLSIARMEKPRPRSAGLLRFHGGNQ